MHTIKTTKNIFEEGNAITHGGIFHADEVFATVILAELQDITVWRAVKLSGDVVRRLMKKVIIYDIGYDIGYGEYDHHQPGGNGKRDNGIPYAAAGLIWKKFGKEILEKKTQYVEKVWEIIDKELIQGIDSLDNGHMPKTNYPASILSITGIISMFNPNWDEYRDSDEYFLEAVEIAKKVWKRTLKSAIAKADAEEQVEVSIEWSRDHIMVLEKYLPWQGCVFNSANKRAEDIWFVVYPSNRGGYNWQCVPDSIGSFGQRHPVPKEWRGLHDQALREKTGVQTATFCHPAGFIGGAETLVDAIKMANIAASR